MKAYARTHGLRYTRPLIAHVVFRFDIGGLENGVVNLINRLPEESYRHAIISLTEITDFRARVARADVLYFALGKKPGQGFWLYPKLFRLFRKLGPSIVHTRNLAALEASLPAWLAGVPVRQGTKLDPCGMGRCFERLSGKDQGRTEWLSTQATRTARAERLKAELAALPKKSPKPFTFEWEQVQTSLGSQPVAAP